MKRCCFLIILLALAPWSSIPAAPVKVDAAQLERWRLQYPEADTNHDGKLTVEEALAYRQKLERRPNKAAAPVRSDFDHEYTFATVSDGTRIALAVSYPRDFKTSPGRKWPTIFMIYGYALATQAINPANFADQCVMVSASLRGTGASGGTLNPWTPRSAQDGYEIIENWIVKQPWSNGRVAITGHSWPGLMGFLVASTNPPSLKAVCVSGLIDDFYRGVAYPGGIANHGFPLEWMNNFYRPDGAFGSDAAARENRKMDTEAYRQVADSRPARDLSQDILWLALQERCDGPKWREVALCNVAAKIRAPILISQTFQDEQTGPNGWWLWKALAPDVPKRLLISNGTHGTHPANGKETLAWFQCFLLEQGDKAVADPAQRVQCYFETAVDRASRSLTLNKPLAAADLPLPQTRWTRYYLRQGHALAVAAPGKDESQDRYQVSYGDPLDKNRRVEYAVSFKESTAICGPMTLTLWAKTSTLDTDFFALLCDRDAQGHTIGLQRGMLRASHRALDEARSEYAASEGGKVLIRPFHPCTAELARPVMPHEAFEYQIEVPLLGHVFRPGHQLVLTLSQPPDGDPIGISSNASGASYRYDSNLPVGEVEVLHDAAHPSSLLLPVLPQLPPVAAEPPALGSLAGIQEVKDAKPARKAGGFSLF